MAERLLCTTGLWCREMGFMRTARKRFTSGVSDEEWAFNAPRRLVAGGRVAAPTSGAGPLGRHDRTGFINRCVVDLLTTHAACHAGAEGVAFSCRSLILRVRWR